MSKVTQLVQEAQGKASHTEEIMNKFAKIYTPVVLTVALLIFAIPAILAEANVSETFFLYLYMFLFALQL